MKRVCSGSALGLATGRCSVPGMRLLHGHTTLCYSDRQEPGMLTGQRRHHVCAPSRSCMLSIAPKSALVRPGGWAVEQTQAAWAARGPVGGLQCMVCHLPLAHNPHDSLRCAAQSAVSACNGRAPRGRRCWWTMTRPSTLATGPTTPAWALTRATASSERCPRARSTIQRCAYAAACTNVARARVGLAPPAAWADTRCVHSPHHVACVSLTREFT